MMKSIDGEEKKWLWREAHHIQVSDRPGPRVRPQFSILLQATCADRSIIWGRVVIKDAPGREEGNPISMVASLYHRKFNCMMSLED